MRTLPMLPAPQSQSSAKHESFVRKLLILDVQKGAYAVQVLYLKDTTKGTGWSSDNDPVGPKYLLMA